MKFIYNKYKGDKTIYYAEDFMACDIESSHNHNENNPKCWISSIQVYFQNNYHLFRKPSEFCDFLINIIDKYNLNSSRRLWLIFHNASYDLSYLIGFFQKYLPYKNETTILNDRHKIKHYRQGGISILDTYGLSNCSLQTWGKNLNVKHKKKVGLYDYDKVIFQDTDLSENEQEYDKYDVLCLYECFEKQLKNYGDTTATVPMTATGYIRREFRKIAINNRQYKEMFRENRLNEKEFNLCVKAFAGGYTHGNRYQQNLVKGRIGHRDFRSHYPSQMRCYPLPFGKPQILYDIDLDGDYFDTKILDDIYPDFSSIITIIITKAQLKDKKITMPFMQYSKLFNIHEEKLKLDNGRILFFKGYAELVIDNLTLKILREQYNIEGKITYVMCFRNMRMPLCLTTTIDKYFLGKSNNKILHQKYEKLYGEFAEETIEQADTLRRDKNGLNGCYGMFVQNPIHENYNVDYDLIDLVDDIFNPIKNEKTTQEQLDDYYDNRNNFLPYQVGVFVTALARYELYEYIKIIGYENVLYCDTDSIFYLKTEEIEKKIEEFNKIKNENAEKLGAFITDSNGKKIYYDVFEAEEDGIAFLQKHAKCYGIILKEKDKEILKATIAGVPERTLIGMKEDKPIYLTREEELGGITKEMKLKGEDNFSPWVAIENITDKYTFYVNTGTTSNYLVERPHTEIIDGHEVETCGGCIIKQLESKKIKDMTSDDFEFSVVVNAL